MNGGLAANRALNISTRICSDAFTLPVDASIGSRLGWYPKSARQVGGNVDSTLNFDNGR